MKYIYGPVKSRRLGNSLGVSLIPHKTCNFNCIYCQLGKTDKLSTRRKEYILADEILQELKNWLSENPAELPLVNYITLSGLGEPTLNVKIAEIISKIKKASKAPVAVITNSSLLADKNVRAQIMEADLIVPSLDSVIPEVFRKIDAPHPSVKLGNIIDGLISLRKEYKGKIWIEVMLVKGVNDDLTQVGRLKEVLDRINPDKIQLNSPVRTSNSSVLSVSKSKLEAIRKLLGNKAEII